MMRKTTALLGSRHLSAFSGRSAARRAQRNERTLSRGKGQSMVEMAIAMPLLCLIMLGTIDVGRVFFDYIQIRNAAMEGAIYGARNPTDTVGIKQRVTDHGVPSDVTTTVNLVGNCSTLDTNGTRNDRILVTVSRTYTPISLDALELVGSGVDWTFDVSSVAEARCMT
jgi:Flp pilus assembly protein TadG